MGINGGMSFYHSVKYLQMNEFLSICSGLSGSVNPTIYINCNWVANFLGQLSGDYVRKIVDVFSILSMLGFIVHPVIDGDKRHHSKWVSVGQRSLRKELAIVTVKNPSKGYCVDSPTKWGWRWIIWKGSRRFEVPAHKAREESYIIRKNDILSVSETFFSAFGWWNIHYQSPSY